MKKIFFFALLLFLANFLCAQIPKGTYVPSIAVNGAYTNSIEKDSAHNIKSYNSQAGLTIRYGKFIKENLLLSGQLNYTKLLSSETYSYTTIPNSDYSYQSNKNVATAGILLSRYKFITESLCIDFGPSFNLSFADGIITQNRYISSNNLLNKQSSYQNSVTAQVYFTAGLQYFLNKNLAISGSLGAFSLGYTTSPYLKEKKHIDQNSFNFYLTPSFNFFNAGLTYYIRPKTEAQ